MAVTVEIDPTVGGANANSYASIEDADTYANTRVGPAAVAWRALGSTDSALDAKARALITATRDIDSIPSDEFDFIGDPSTETQALEFPRDGSDELPQRLVDATIELAMLYASGSATVDPLSTASNNRKKVEDDGTSVEFFAPEKISASGLERFPAVVQRLLSGLVIALQTSGVWGTGHAVRMS